MNTIFTRNINGRTYSHRREIYNKIQDLLSFYTNKHSKALIIRFDIRYPKSYQEECINAHISDCIGYIIVKYKRYGLDPYYLWVREQHHSEHPHYHVVLFLDGQKMRNYSHVFDTVEEIWARVLGCDVRGCIHHCTDPEDIDSNGFMFRRCDGEHLYTSRRQQVLDRLSYLSKSFSKADENDGMRNFGCSRFR